MPGKRKIIKIFFVTLLVIPLLLTLLTAGILILVNLYKNEITGKVISELQNVYSVSIRYDKIKVSVTDNWPKITVKLKNPEIISTNEDAGGIPFFKCQSLSLSLNALRFMKKEIEIEEATIKNGKIELEKNSAGKINFEIRRLIPLSPVLDETVLKIKKVTLRNVSLDFYNRQKKKHIGIMFVRNVIDIKWFGKDIVADISGKLKVNELLFKPDKGPLFYNKKAEVDLHAVYINAYKTIFIEKTSDVVINRQKYHLSGKVYFDSLPGMALNIAAHVKDFSETLTLLNFKVQRNLAFLKVRGPVQASVTVITGFNSEEDPELNVKFLLANNNLEVGNERMPFSNVSGSGELICAPDSNGIPDMNKAWLAMNNISGRVYGFPFSGNLKVNNFHVPYFKTHVLMEVNTAQIGFKVRKDFDLNGLCYADIHYEGPAVGIKRSTFLKPPMKLKARISFDHLRYKTKNSDLTFTLTGKSDVNNDKMRFRNLVLNTAGGDFKIRGRGEGFTSYVCNSGDGFSAEIQAGSSFFDLTPLIQKVKRKGPDHDKQSKERISKNDFEFNISVDIDKLKIRKMMATEVRGSVNYIDDVISVRKLDLNTCEGNISANGYLYNYSKAVANIQLNEVNVRLLFEQCEDFRQRAIQSGNVSGNLSATTSVNMDFGEHFQPRPKSLNADVKAVLKNGHLINYKPLQNISGFLFKRRNFSDVSFTEISPVFQIRGSEMKIDDLEVASSILNFFVSGTYDFKESSNLNLLVPWSNLKSRDRDYVPRKLGKEHGSEKGLKLNLYGYPDKMKIRLGHK